MPFQTSTPSFVAVFLANVAGGYEFEIAGGADIVVTFVALEAMEAGVGRLDGVGADVTVLADSEGDVGV